MAKFDHRYEFFRPRVTVFVGTAAKPIAYASPVKRQRISFTLSAVLLGLVTSSAAALAQPGVSAEAIAIDAPYVEAVAPAAQRDGLMWGVSIGRGSIAVECDSCDNVDALTEALSYSGHVGWMVMPRLAVVLEHWAVRYNDRGSEWFNDSADHLVAQQMNLLEGQLWVTDRLWVMAGLGYGKHISDSRYANPAWNNDSTLRAGEAGPGGMSTESYSEYAPAAMLAAGFEFARTTTFAVDVQLRVASTRRAANEYQIHNTGFVFGINWY